MEICSSSVSATLQWRTASPSRPSHLPSSSAPSSPLSLPSHLRFTKPLPFSLYSRTHPSLRLVVASAAKAKAKSFTIKAKEKLPADIEVEEFLEPNSSVRLSINVPTAVCDDCYNRVMTEYSKLAKIPGFRPRTRVPDDILMLHVGKQNVLKATIESVLKRTLPHAMSSVTGKALKDSMRITTNFADLEEAYSSSNSLRYDVLVDVVPEIRWNPENGYKSLNVVVEIDNEIAAESVCEQEIRRRQKALGTLRIVIDRGLQIGDVAVLDISATTIGEGGSDAEKIPSAESKGCHFDTEDEDKVLPGFLDSIVGIQRGETKSFPLLFPESWRQENLRGVRAQFTVECKELFYRDLPELDDSLADKLLPGCTTVEQVRESLMQMCQELEQRSKEQATDNAILDQLCKMVEVDIPRSLFEEEGRQIYGAKILEIQGSMKLTEDQLSSLSSPRAVNEYLEHEKENIENIIKQNLAVGDIFKRENLQVSTKELVTEVQNSIKEFKRNEQEYDEARIKEQVQEVLEGAKVLEWLREHATIQYMKDYLYLKNLYISLEDEKRKHAEWDKKKWELLDRKPLIVKMR
ncbi:Trigger factor-like protein, partial [Drosera capensis]